MSSLKSVIIITGSTSSIKSVSSIVRQSSTAQWLYCGKDVPFSLELDIELDRITKMLYELQEEITALKNKK